MIRKFTLIFAILISISSLPAQSDEAFLQVMATFDYRMEYPREEDLGVPLDQFDAMYDRELMQQLYTKVTNERKAYIKSQIGIVTSELLFQQILDGNFSEEEIYQLAKDFDPIAFKNPYGRQVKNIANYVKRKKSAIGSFFSPLTFTDEMERKISLPSLEPNEYILLHFWSSYCKKCMAKNQYFTNHSESYKKKQYHIISICTDYFPRNWKKVLEKHSFSNPQLYLNRVAFMDIAQKYTLELSSTILLDNTYTIVQRGKYKLEDLFDQNIVK